MSPIQNYFFTNNIEVWNTRKVSNGTWFNTDSGQYVEREDGHLYKIDEDTSERVV